MTTRKKIDKHNDRLIQKGLTRFFYGKILDALYNCEESLVEDEAYEAAAKVRDNISRLEDQFKKELDEI